MKSALLKDIFREISHTKSRFLSIFAIIALGAGFFSGLKATCPDMLMTETLYYSETNLMDFRLVSTYGFSDEDIDAIRNTENVRTIYPTYFKDAFIKNDENIDIIARIMTCPDESSAQYADKTINTPIVLEGRMPENDDECVIEKHSQMKKTYDVGDKITFFTTDSDDPFSDSLERDTFTVVGIIMDPMYISYERGSSEIGSGSINTFVLIPESNFKYEVFSEVYVTLDTTYGVGAFEDEYQSAVDDEEKVFEALADIREPGRLSEIKAEAQEEIDDAKAEIEDGKKKIADAEEELADAEKELADAKKELLDGEKELADGKKEYDEGLEEFNTKIADAEEELEKARKEIANGYREYRDGLRELEAGEKEFYDNLDSQGLTMETVYSSYEQVTEGIKTAEETKATLEETKLYLESLAQYDPSILESENYLTVAAGYEQVVATIAGLEENKASLEQVITAYNTIESGKAELAEGKEALDDGAKEYSKGYDKFIKEKEEGEQKLADALKEIKDAEKKLSDGWDEYEDGLVEYEDAKADAQVKIADAKEDIAKGENDIAQAEKDISELKMPKWYIFTRDDNPGYSTFENDAYRVERVCKVFPLFFLLVAMLVCLTTMTRMVEEKRTEIGTLKALGYSRFDIAKKFVIYALLASLFGSVFGIGAGVIIFPKAVYSAYAIMYKTPSLRLGTMWGLWVIVVIACLLCTTLAAIMACMSELKSSPAVLMRPKAPKAGKRVLLENIGFIWKKLKFTQKVTIRNLFRYKKRIFMTIIGIAGCTALTLTGIGLYTSIGVIVDKQYSDIFCYDVTFAVDTDATEDEEKEFYSEIENNEYIDSSLKVFAKAINFKGVSDMTIMIPEETDDLDRFIRLKDRLTNEKYTIPDDGIIVTERFTEVTGINLGDVITFSVGEDTITAKITDVCENYAGHIIYMSKEFYEKNTGKLPQWNTVFAVLNDNGEKAHDTLAKKMVPFEAVLAVSFVSSSMESFSDIIRSLDLVVILVISCAALLAFIVLFNLTNINLTERIREIATIKVLGFYDMEVSEYVFRENLILAVMGDLAGLFVGIYFHKFIISVSQTDSVMFGRDLPLWTFVAAFAMTVAFAYIVNFIMYFKLKNVSMVESLKSIE